MAEEKMGIIKELIEAGKKKGALTNKEILDMLEDVDIDVEVIEKLYETLEHLGIEIIADLEDVSDNDLIPQPAQSDKAENATSEGIAIEDPVRMYLKEIGKVNLLSADEEVDLAKRMAQGDEAAKRRLAEANLRLVVSIASVM